MRLTKYHENLFREIMQIQLKFHENLIAFNIKFLYISLKKEKIFTEPKFYEENNKT